MRIEDLFGESPFLVLKEHGRKVHECVGELRSLFPALEKGDEPTARAIADRIVVLETEADKIQSRLQERLAARVLVPVDKQQLFHVMEQQDGMADAAEDIAVVATCRPLRLPEPLWREFEAYHERTLEICRLVAGIMDRMDLLVESSFQGRDALSVSKLITEADEKEDAIKGMQTVLVRRLFGPEGNVAAEEFTIWWQIVDGFGRLARSADQTAGGVRLMLKGH